MNLDLYNNESEDGSNADEEESDLTIESDEDIDTGNINSRKAIEAALSEKELKKFRTIGIAFKDRKRIVEPLNELKHSPGYDLFLESMAEIVVDPQYSNAEKRIRAIFKSIRDSELVQHASGLTSKDQFQLSEKDKYLLDRISVLLGNMQKIETKYIKIEKGNEESPGKYKHTVIKLAGEIMRGIEKLLIKEELIEVEELELRKLKAHKIQKDEYYSSDAGKEAKMRQSERKKQKYEEQGRRLKNTPENLAKVKLLLGNGLTRVQIASVMGVNKHGIFSFVTEHKDLLLNSNITHSLRLPRNLGNSRKIIDLINEGYTSTKISKVLTAELDKEISASIVLDYINEIRDGFHKDESGLDLAFDENKYLENIHKARADFPKSRTKYAVDLNDEDQIKQFVTDYASLKGKELELKYNCSHKRLMKTVGQIKGRGYEIVNKQKASHGYEFTEVVSTLFSQYFDAPRESKHALAIKIMDELGVKRSAFGLWYEKWQVQNGKSEEVEQGRKNPLVLKDSDELKEFIIQNLKEDKDLEEIANLLHGKLKLKFPISQGQMRSYLNFKGIEASKIKDTTQFFEKQKALWMNLIVRLQFPEDHPDKIKGGTRYLAEFLKEIPKSVQLETIIPGRTIIDNEYEKLRIGYLKTEEWQYYYQKLSNNEVQVGEVIKEMQKQSSEDGEIRLIRVDVERILIDDAFKDQRFLNWLNTLDTTNDVREQIINALNMSSLSKAGGEYLLAKLEN